MTEFEPAFEPLDPARHDRAGFNCGQNELTAYFQKFARQDVSRNAARVFVGVLGGQVCGYYTLSASSIEIEELPPQLLKNLPRYKKVPCALIGRLAVDLRFRGRGLGELLLADAIRRVNSANAAVAMAAIAVDTKDDAAASFYRHFGFIELSGNSRKLFILTDTANSR